MKIEQYIDNNFDQMIQAISKIVAIPTVKSNAITDAPYGLSLKKGLVATLQLAEELGFKTVNLDNYIGYAEYGEGEEYIAILGHIDVVPEGEGWKTPPFQATVVDKNLYGRGVLDNKAPIISSLYSLKAVLEENPLFDTKVRIIFGCNEESGTDDIEYYLSKELPPKFAFTPDGRFPVIHAEKGMVVFSLTKKIISDKITSIKAGNKSNVVPHQSYIAFKNLTFLEKEQLYQQTIQYDNNIFQVFGKSAHAASPQKGENAICKLFQILNQIFDDEVIHFFLENFGIDYYGETLGIACEDIDSGKLTNNIAVINYNGQELYIKCNFRYPVTEDGEKLIAKLTKKFGSGFQLLSHAPPLYFPKDSFFIQTLHSVYIECTKREESPVAIGGGTYAKLMPNTVAFGPNFPELNSKAHQENEFIPLDTIKIGAIIYAHALKKMSLL